MAASVLKLIRMMPAYAHLKLLGSIDPNFWLSFVHLDPASDFTSFHRYIEMRGENQMPP
jgi:hypothetical protein